MDMKHPPVLPVGAVAFRMQMRTGQCLSRLQTLRIQRKLLSVAVAAPFA